MTGHLRAAGDDDAPVRCRLCGALAAGPCASCRAPVCGDCCELTEGGARTWAICLGCARRGGVSLRRAWLGLLGWILVPVGLLALLAVLLALVRR